MILRQRLSRRSPALTLTLTALVSISALCQVPTPEHFSSNPPAEPQSSPPASPELKGDLLSARQHYVEAIQAYSQCPQNSAVIANKTGVAYHHMFAVADAKRYYERAIQLNPRYPEAINNLGAIYVAEKNYGAALRLYRKAIKLNPRSPLFYGNLGTAYFFQGNISKGADAYRKAFALDPEVFERSSAARIEETSSTKDMSYVNYALAKTYAQAGQNERALVYLRKALGEGFNDRRRLMNDPEFASVRVTPEFTQLLSIQRAQ